jgi:TonB family protein
VTSMALTSPALLRPGGPSAGTTLGVSVAVHLLAALVAAVWWAPGRDGNRPPREVMTISLGGAPGPRAGGLTQMGGLATPIPPQPPREVSRPEARPATRTPQPTPSGPARPATPPSPVDTAPPARTLPDPVEPGNTPVNTGARGQGFGLSSGGGGTRGVELDVGNFCCPEYLSQMITLIQRNWQQGHGVTGTTTMLFTIRRDGTIDGVAVERSSRFLALDNAADRALRLTRQLPPLPAPFPNPSLTVHMKFEYQP